MPSPFKPLDPDAEVSQKRRNLPHWEQGGCAYFITFRTCDSLPREKLAAIREQKEAWNRTHPEPWDKHTWDEYHRLFTERMQRWLDAGYGECLMAKQEVRTLVASALQHFDGTRYSLDEFVVMPNHVHAIACPLEGYTLAGILHTWKSYTAHEINTLFDRRGHFWMDERFDHAVRSAVQLEHFRGYIQANPKKAGLAPGTYSLGRGSGIGLA